MRILRVTSSLYPDKVGGIGVHAYEMSKEQARLGSEVTVYTLNVNRRQIQEFKDGYKIIRFKPVLKFIGNSLIPLLFFKLIRTRNDFDVIHAHSHLFFSTNLCAFVKKFGSPPLVITNHGIMSASAPNWFNKIYMRTIGKWTLRSADRVICYTDTEKRKLENLGIISRKITVIHNGIDANRFIPREKESHSEICILWIGRVVLGKGVEYLIDAIKLLVNDIPNLKLIMIGEGPSKEKIKRKISDLGLDKSITFEDFVLNSELPLVYQNSDIFVLPSINEGIPRTILEAMSCGIPIVCTELPQLADVVKGCGLLVPARDSQALAEGISKIISDRELAQKFGKNGRANVVENYSWEDTVKKTIQLYEEVLWQK